jgi:YD repeat-containing protein
VVTVAGPNLDRHAVTAIRAVEGVQKVSWDGQDQLKVIVEDAGSTVPVLVEALRAADIDVDEVSEQHASFDDVFVQLMESQSVGQPAGESRAQETH